jgi:hypothetical protein
VRQARLVPITHTDDGLDHHSLLTAGHSGRCSKWKQRYQHFEPKQPDGGTRGPRPGHFQQGSNAHLWSVPLLIASVLSQALLSPQSGTAAAVSFITFVQDLKRKSKAWAPMIELCASGEKTLERFRYQFPDDWLYGDQLRGEWSAYNEILKRKSDSIQEQLGIVV